MRTASVPSIAPSIRPRLTLSTQASSWPYAEPFVIARGAILGCEALELEVADDDHHTGRAEVYGIPYAGETPASMRAQIDAVADDVCDGLSRYALLDRLPAGGARCAIDCALWDLDAKRGGADPFAAYGLAPAPVVTAYTIGIRDHHGYVAAAALRKGAPWLKVKVDADDPVGAVEAVRRGAPSSALIVDPNQAWTIEQLKDVAPALARSGVALIEQPLPAGREADLDGYRCPIPLCADESLDDLDDLPAIVGRFQAVNIKLDKAGGLTAAMRLADAAVARGLDLMVGCMGGTSLSMAPAMVLAQRCRYIDLDAPAMLVRDRANGFEYRDGVVRVTHEPALWG